MLCARVERRLENDLFKPRLPLVRLKHLDYLPRALVCCHAFRKYLARYQVYRFLYLRSALLHDLPHLSEKDDNVTRVLLFKLLVKRYLTIHGPLGSVHRVQRFPEELLRGQKADKLVRLVQFVDELHALVLEIRDVLDVSCHILLKFLLQMLQPLYFFRDRFPKHGDVLAGVHVFDMVVLVFVLKLEHVRLAVGRTPLCQALENASLDPVPVQHPVLHLATLQLRIQTAGERELREATRLPEYYLAVKRLNDPVEFADSALEQHLLRGSLLPVETRLNGAHKTERMNDLGPKGLLKHVN